MRITIAQRLRPFSHAPGTYCLLPGSFLRFQFFPTRIVIDDLSGPTPKAVTYFDLNLSGPVKDFTVQQDLEKGILRVWGHYREGFVRYSITSGKEPHSFIFKMEKSPKSGVKSETLKITLHAKEVLCFLNGDIVSELLFLTVKEHSRLSLGSHKAQDWNLVQRRVDLAEIFPVWHRLGKMLPETTISRCEGALKLLEKCSTFIEEGTKLEVYESFQNLFLAGMEGILSPRLIDIQHQGFAVDALPKGFQGSPMVLLTEGAKIISKLFVQIRDHGIEILPLLPPEFHCGRMLSVSCGELGEVDIEWSKKTIRRMVFRSEVCRTIPFGFQKGLKSYRLRFSEKDKGKRVNVGEAIACESGKIYFLDNFLK